MLGRRPGYVTTQGGVLADLFASAGYRTIAVSSVRNRAGRFADIVATLVRHRHEIDCVMLEVYGRLSFVVEDTASRIASSANIPVIMVLHSGSFPKFIARFPRWSRRTLERADALAAPSPFLARAVAPHGFDVQVIPNVIDVSQLPYRPRRELKPRLLWMRTFYPYYNPQMAVRAVADLQADMPGVELVMGGRDKGIQQDVERLARELGVARAVRFAGFLDAAGKAREGAAADIFVNTNQVDNTPVSVLEACAMGMAVVATDVGGIRDVLTDGETALLVPDGDHAAMAAAVRRLCREPDLAERLSTNGRALALRSSWAAVRPQWERLIRDVMTNRRKRAVEVGASVANSNSITT
jgi:glycosyltransferase involved in cell wall biosynthesis